MQNKYPLPEFVTDKDEVLRRHAKREFLMPISGVDDQGHKGYYLAKNNRDCYLLDWLKDKTWKGKEGMFGLSESTTLNDKNGYFVISNSSTGHKKCVVEERLPQLIIDKKLNKISIDVVVRVYNSRNKEASVMVLNRIK